MPFMKLICFCSACHCLANTKRFSKPFWFRDTKKQTWRVVSGVSNSQKRQWQGLMKTFTVNSRVKATTRSFDLAWLNAVKPNSRCLLIFKGLLYPRHWKAPTSAITSKLILQGYILRQSRSLLKFTSPSKQVSSSMSQQSRDCS